MRYWLKELRQKNNYSMTYMAQKMGISRPYYSYIEHGERLSDLSFSIAIKISKIFNISLNDIQKFEERTQQQNENHNQAN